MAVSVYKLIKALVISAGTTLGAAVLLKHLDSRERAETATEPSLNGEVDADRLTADERDALLAELEGQI
ncbi:MAG: hypothetical protein HKN29_06935 [Rhodothermales bacterium]|nr:hypothetical protein [Rhodothermales bacterium]